MRYHGGDGTALLRQTATWEWWDHERPHFMLFASNITEQELADGYFRGQKDALALLARARFLPSTATVIAATRAFLAAGIVPATKPADAAHLAFASVHGVDYLLSWNHSHLSNSETQRKLEVVNKRLGWRSPILCSPDSIPKFALGQVVRRRA
jgi:predicted nucleic acid-binding protein